MSASPLYNEQHQQLEFYYATFDTKSVLVDMAESLDALRDKLDSESSLSRSLYKDLSDKIDLLRDAFDKHLIQLRESLWTVLDPIFRVQQELITRLQLAESPTPAMPTPPKSTPLHSPPISSSVPSCISSSLSSSAQAISPIQFSDRMTATPQPVNHSSNSSNDEQSFPDINNNNNDNNSNSDDLPTVIYLTCPYPTCCRTFKARSTMLRHTKRHPDMDQDSIRLRKRKRKQIDPDVVDLPGQIKVYSVKEEEEGLFEGAEQDLQTSGHPKQKSAAKKDEKEDEEEEDDDAFVDPYDPIDDEDMDVPTEDGRNKSEADVASVLSDEDGDLVTAGSSATSPAPFQTFNNENDDDEDDNDNDNRNDNNVPADSSKENASQDQAYPSHLMEIWPETITELYSHFYHGSRTKAAYKDYFAKHGEHWRKHDPNMLKKYNKRLLLMQFISGLAKKSQTSEEHIVVQLDVVRCRQRLTVCKFVDYWLKGRKSGEIEALTLHHLTTLKAPPPTKRSRR